MTCIVIDPYLVLLPNPCNSSDQLDNFVEGLLNWSEAIYRKELPVFISDTCVNGLYQDKWIPFDGRLTTLLNKFDADNADEETINLVLRNILDRTPRLEDHLEIQDICFEEKTVNISPDLFLNRLGENTSKALTETLALVGIGEKYLESIQPECYFATNECLDVDENDKVSSNVEVLLIELSENSQFFVNDADFPIKLNHELTVCFGYNNVLISMDVLDLWDEASSVGNVTDAINKMIILHREIGLPTDRKEFSIYTFGAHFLGSIHSYGFHARHDWARLLIESCARIILGIPKNDVEEFREDERSQSAQRTRGSDRALAWRTHLTKSNEGFRLMFWTTADGVIEFANIGPKKELIIFE
ncbi:MAG: hypothetical protein A2X25_12845 [Chloroflexi bacterium GWB2_49_20]|nr:MAG: hypothetical protein A2X25_12845 [Chloroflexi bacterium GWB2_49_20]OGN78394.1 MAG: hypothetical protein A2X26_01355 [Chloroflexi bacterium GWC2_49_37]OGN84142.1 MAG: hypothetical protein A2X27_14330 [Chloroflexi bacterium GWD2_49_16]HBG75208.1 hypothetical protein [Anaerolineae bacterium]HCC79157.1 hypothetical protein [Anaerolineae bacterium]